MKYHIKYIGVAALAFGAGVLLCLILSAKALVFTEAALVIGAGLSFISK